MESKAWPHSTWLWGKKNFPTKNDLPGGAGCVFLRQPIIVSHSKSRLSPLFFWTMDILKCIGDSAFQDEQDKQKIRLDFYGRSNSTGDIKIIFLFSENREKQSCRPCFSTDFFRFCFKKSAVPHCIFVPNLKINREKLTSQGRRTCFYTSSYTTGSEQVTADLFRVSKFFVGGPVGETEVFQWDRR